MADNDYIRRLQFNRKEYHEVLGRMQTGATAKGAEDRSRDRHDYPLADIPLTIDHPEGGTSRFLVYGRNISRSGIGVLHGGFVHTGSSARVVLERDTGELMTVECEVRHCRLVAGSCHEIGLRFNDEIDPAQLRVPDEDDEKEGEGGFLAISGTVLIADAFAPDADLLRHHLSMFGVAIETVSTPEDALAAVRDGTIDLVLYGVNLAAPDGLPTLHAMREQGFKGPIIAMTAETGSEILDQARQHGATAVVAKPYNVDLLVAELQVHLGAAPAARTLHSTAIDQPGMPPLIVHFIKVVRQTADQIERMHAEAQWMLLREYCCQLKGSGCNYGFQNLTVAAMAVLGALDNGRLMKGDTSSIDALLQCCRALECDLPTTKAA